MAGMVITLSFWEESSRKQKKLISGLFGTQAEPLSGCPYYGRPTPTVAM